jgi:hypothetical protein
MSTRLLSIATVAFFAAAPAVIAGCSDDDPSSTQSSSSASGSGGAGGTGDEGGAGGTGGGTGGQGGAGGQSGGIETLVGFDPAKYEFVEGLDYRGGTAYVGAVITGAVFSVDVAAKQAKPFGATPPIPPNQGALVGLSLGPDDLLYAAVNSFSPSLQTGVYRFSKAGGEATLFASDPALKFANDIRFDAAGDFFVTDSMSGTIFKVSKDGMTVTPWASDPLLQPDPAVCGVVTDFHLGVNGIVRRGDAFYVTNTDRASVVKIPIMADGKAGAPEIYLATDCATLSGADGIIVDPHSDDLLVAVNYKNTILRVKPDKSIMKVAEGAPLQSPASLAIDKERDALLITSAAFESIMDPAKAKPALVSLPLQ